MSMLQRSASRLCRYASRCSAGAFGPHSISTGVAGAGQNAASLAPVAAISAVCAPFQHMTRSFASEPAANEDEERELGNEKVHALVEELIKLDILEFSDLTKLLARKLGLPETPMMGGMMMAPGGAPAAGAPAAAADAPPAEEEKTSFTVKLDGFDASSKIKVIKEIRAITQLGLKEAKELVEGAPCVVKPGCSKEEAEEIKKKLEDVGGKIVLE